MPLALETRRNDLLIRHHQGSKAVGKLLAIHSFRGGTGKSNITGNIAAALAQKGFRVGLIDTDIQSPGVHALFGIAPESVSHTLNDYLLEKCKVEEAACDVTAALMGKLASPKGKLFLIPSSMRSAEITHIIQSGYDVGRLNMGFQQLIQHLNLDFLLVDTHPGVNEETLLAAAISDGLILVMRPDRQDYQGTSVMLELARMLRVPRISLVINKAVGRSDFDLLKHRVETTFKTEVLAVIPLLEELAALGSSDLFCVKAPDHEFSVAVRKIADALS